MFFFHPKKGKNTHFSSKMASPPATCDVITCKHSNRCSPILCQNVCKGYLHSYLKRQVEMILRLAKFKKNLMRGGGGGVGVASTLPLVRLRVNTMCHIIMLFKDILMLIRKHTRFSGVLSIQLSFLVTKSFKVTFQ